jgi:hypothetical protein
MEIVLEYSMDFFKIDLVVDVGGYRQPQLGAIILERKEQGVSSLSERSSVLHRIDKLPQELVVLTYKPSFSRHKDLYQHANPCMCKLFKKLYTPRIWTHECHSCCRYLREVRV